MRRTLFLLGIIVLSFCSCTPKLTLDDYVIIVPDSPTDVEKRAANELQRYFNEISGKQLLIISDKEVASDKEILIGNTNRAKLDSLSQLEADGFIIHTIGNKLAIHGGYRNGVLYGVYELLETEFGCRRYTSDAEIIPKQDHLVINAAINNKQVPVITERYAWSQFPTDTVTNDWLRLNQDPSGDRPDWGLWVHTFNTLLPPDLYKEHPEYFALVKGRRGTTQPCLSNPVVLEIMCENLRKEIEKKPDAKYWSVSSNDNFQYCQCEHCAAIDAEEGSPAGSVVQFVNKVAERFPDKVISTLGYQYTRKAPSKTKPLPNVNIMFCSIECDRSVPIAENKRDSGFCKDMEDWSRLTNNIIVWDYGVSFNELQRPFPNWAVLQPNVQFFVKNNVNSMFFQLAGNIKGEFCELRHYMVSRLMWNPNLDYSAVMDDFLKGYYGAAAPHVREYLNLITENMEKSGVWLNTQRYCIEYEDTWLTPDCMRQYEAIMDKAVAAVADNPELLKRAKIARKSVYFAQLELSRRYPYSADGFLENVDGKWKVKEVFVDKLEEFTEMCKEQGVERVTEWHSTPDEYRAQMLNMYDIQQEGNLAYRKPVKSSIEVEETRNPRGEGLPLLTDGLRGTQIWTSQWLGFHAPNVEFDVDLEELKNIKHIDSHHLQIMWESAFFPEKVEALTSMDGVNFKSVGIQTQVISNDPFFGTKRYNFDFAARTARYVRLRIKALDVCPTWHYYSGDPALMFIDEIVVR